MGSTEPPEAEPPAAAPRLPPAWTIKRRALRRVAAAASAALGARAGGKVGILMYHRVAEQPPGASPLTWNVTPRRFERQIAGLLARGFRPWPLQQVLDRDGPIPPRTFVITFDDGYASVHRHAWPILKALGAPATVFLATAYLDSEAAFPFDDWPEAGSARVPPDTWRLMTTAQCRELVEGGLVTLGAHTHTHRDFRDRPADLAPDLARCVGFLRTELGLERPSFAFPFGYAGPALVDAARQAGVACALNVREELVDPAGDPFAWGRFEAGEADSAATLAACLDGWCDALRARLRRP